ncbi:MAG: 3'(2'), 5'-bisphosphate nucleotidase [Halioglobus sp.]|jgi:3'(2'), 5'-bisphosphate nucleotidase
MENDLKSAALEQLVAPLLPLCRHAGEVIREHYYAPDAADFEAKGDDSPLTRADLASDAILQAGLLAIDSNIPVLSEESAPVDLSQRREWQRYWLVDPLDGTREFLDRTGEFTINIALIEEHRPVLGVLYLPLEELAYVGIPDVLARCYRVPDTGPWPWEALETRQLTAGEPLEVLASPRHKGPRLHATLDWLKQHWGPLTRKNSGSALKFCQLAAGEGDFYPRFSPCCEWDTAAGQAVLEAAGGALLGLDGMPLQYNRQDSLYSPDFFGIAQPGAPLWREFLAHIKP